MQFDTYKIENPELAKYVQYILFNHSSEAAAPGIVTSYANTNICLGIIKEQEFTINNENLKYFRHKKGIHSYLSGMYLKPHQFLISENLDEICIDFSPAGYHKFFKTSLKTYITGEDILQENWGAAARAFFEKVFDTNCFQQRGRLIESFLLTRINGRQPEFLQHALGYMNHYNGHISLSALATILRCSEKKITRYFQSILDIGPKDYLRIMRFRKAMGFLSSPSGKTLTDIAYETNFYDQSHFIKEIKFFTNETPKYLVENIYSIKNDVLISLQ